MIICETPTCIHWEQSCLQCSLPITASAQFVCTCIAIFMSLHGPNIAVCVSCYSTSGLGNLANKKIGVASF